MEAVAGLLLAAGAGLRVGAPKALLRLDGQLLVERAVGVLREAGCAPIIVVLGAGAERVQAEADLGDVTVVVNQAWGTGLGSSLRAGLEELSGTAAEAAAVLLVDTPGVTAEAVRRVAALPYPEALVCATYAGRRGHPMLLGRAHWSGIALLAKADVGARPYLLARAAEVVAVGCDGISSDDDIDTPEAAAARGITVPPDLTVVVDPAEVRWVDKVHRWPGVVVPDDPEAGVPGRQELPPDERIGMQHGSDPVKPPGAAGVAGTVAGPAGPPAMPGLAGTVAGPPGPVGVPQVHPRIVRQAGPRAENIPDIRSPAGSNVRLQAVPGRLDSLGLNEGENPEGGRWVESGGKDHPAIRG